MKKPIIGITGNQKPDPADTTAPELSYVVTNFVQAVQDAGGIPLILPIGSEEMAKTYISMIDKLIMTGGQNVLPQFYGEEQTITSDDYKLERDVFELALIKEAVRQNKPIFSVCRGTQLFNVAMGGTLHQDIEDHWQDSLADYSSHDMVIDPDSSLASIYGTYSAINSFHHQSIKDLAANLTVIAHSPNDHIIEAVTTNDGYPYLGVQWHPELLFAHRKEDRALFEYVVQQL